MPISRNQEVQETGERTDRKWQAAQIEVLN